MRPPNEARALVWRLWGAIVVTLAAGIVCGYFLISGDDRRAIYWGALAIVALSITLQGLESKR